MSFEKPFLDVETNYYDSLLNKMKLTANQNV